MKELQELEVVLAQNCETYEDDCTKCPYSAQCNRYEKLVNSEV